MSAQDADARLYALASNLSTRGIDAVQRYDRIVVTYRTPGGEHAETITCEPWADDGGRLWFFDSCHRPLAPADRIEDTALCVAARVKEAT